MIQNAQEIVVDFSGVKPFEPLDPSVIYLARVSNFTPGESKGPERNPKISLELTIEGPEEVPSVDENGQPTGNMTKAAGRKLFREYSLQPQALPFLHEFIKAVQPDAELGEDFRLRPAEYIGETVAVKIENEMYEEQIRSRVKRVLPASAYKPTSE